MFYSIAKINVKQITVVLGNYVFIQHKLVFEWFFNFNVFIFYSVSDIVCDICDMFLS